MNMQLEGQSSVAPIEALSLFFDDVRVETDGRYTFVGHYPHQICWFAPSRRLDRLAVFTKLTWKRTMQPTNVLLRLDVTGSAPEFRSIDCVPQTVPHSPLAEYSTAHFVTILRCRALSPCDQIQVWLIANGTEKLTGVLNIRPAKPPAMAHPPGLISYA